MVQLEEIITTVQGIRSRIKNNLTNPGVLATLAVDAATTISYLGDYLADAKAEYENERAKAYLKFMQEKDSNDRADNLAKAETVELKNRVTQLEILHKDIQRIISVIQTKVRTLEGEAKGQF